MLHEVKASYEHYEKIQKQFFTGIGSMLLIFMLFALIMTIGSDFMSFLHVDILQKAIASKNKASEGFMTFVWYISYGLPYIFSIGLFISLYEWIRARIYTEKIYCALRRTLNINVTFYFFSFFVIFTNNFVVFSSKIVAKATKISMIFLQTYKNSKIFKAPFLNKIYHKNYLNFKYLYFKF
ncbi:hypothetical protein ACUW92_000413 [Staphylococcus epidermidis]|nr:DUF334 domain-containing protein [Staphylococcus epidermidis]